MNQHSIKQFLKFETVQIKNGNFEIGLQTNIKSGTIIEDCLLLLSAKVGQVSAKGFSVKTF